MFDYVNFKIACPNCGHEVREFQTKDTECCLHTVEYWETSYFYSACDNCEASITFSRNQRIPPLPYVPLDHFTMTVERRGENK